MCIRAEPIFYAKAKHPWLRVGGSIYPDRVVENRRRQDGRIVGQVGDEERRIDGLPPGITVTVHLKRWNYGDSALKALPLGISRYVIPAMR